MADDHSQRPYRANEAPARNAQGRPSGSGNDPLAELARLIGQSDPFSEFGRENTRRAAPQPAEPAIDWNPAPYAPQQASVAEARPAPAQAVPEAQAYGSQNYARQPFGGAPLASGADLYQTGHDAQAAQGAYEQPEYQPDDAQHAAPEEDYYDDVPPRRRMGVIAIAGIFALAVIGTAGALGYRAIFGSSGSSAPPPVIKADSAPSKVVPQVAKDAQSKLITDRVNDRSAGERLVSREEQPLEMRDKPAGVVYPRNSDSSGALGSGIVGTEPKKIRTIVIHPDGSSNMAEAAPAPVSSPTAPPPRVATNAPMPLADPDPAPPVRQPPVQQQPQRAAAPAAPRNAPLSLNPDAAPAASTRTASVGAPAAIAPAAGNGRSAGGYAVQVSSQRSEGDAQAAFRSLQAKFPAQLGSRQPVISRVDLGAKGIYFRAMVPAGTAGEATELCSSLKAAGGQCIVQRN